MFDGCVKFLDRTQRFPKFPSQPSCSLPQRIQHLFFLRRFDLLGRNGVAILTIHGIQIDHVVATQRINVAGQHSFDALALAQFTRHCTGQAFFGRPAHKAHCFRNLRFRNQIEEGGFVQLHRQRLLKCSVEDRVASCIHKIGKQNGVFLGQRPRFPHVQNTYQSCGRDYRDGACDIPPLASARNCNRAGRRMCCLNSGCGWSGNCGTRPRNRRHHRLCRTHRRALARINLPLEAF